MADQPEKKEEDSPALRILRKVIADERMTAEDISAEDLKRARKGLPPADKSDAASTPIYVVIEKDFALGGPSLAGKIYVVEADGRLKPIDGHDLVELHKHYPNFVRGYRLPEDE